MSPARLAASIGGATLLAAWLANAAAVPKRAVIVAQVPQQPDAADLDILASEVQSQAVRLRERLAQAPAPIAPVRNPFTFRSREAARRSIPTVTQQARATAATGAAEVPVTEMLLALDGIAEQRDDRGTVRTAVVTGAGGEIFMVKEGETLAGRYTVVTITPDVVELRDVTTGVTRRLYLQS